MVCFQALEGQPEQLSQGRARLQVRLLDAPREQAHFGRRLTCAAAASSLKQSGLQATQLLFAYLLPAKRMERCCGSSEVNVFQVSHCRSVDFKASATGARGRNQSFPLHRDP